VVVVERFARARRIWSVAAAAMICAALVTGTAGVAHADPVEIDLTPFFNNIGVRQDPDGTADFDGGGYSYSSTALSIGDPINDYPGVEGGDTIEAGGFSFTWPNRPNQRDNVLTLGQTIPIPSSPGATEVGFLGASVQGAGSGQFIFNYTYTDEFGVEQQRSITRAVSFTDWTRGLLGDAPLEPNNTVVLHNLFRAWDFNALPLSTTPNVFLVTAPLDPSMTLTSIKLPVSPQIHLFGLAVK
jgi:hypothetical protein